MKIVSTAVGAAKMGIQYLPFSSHNLRVMCAAWADDIVKRNAAAYPPTCFVAPIWGSGMR